MEFLSGRRVVVQQGRRLDLGLGDQRRELLGLWWLLCGWALGLGFLGSDGKVEILHGPMQGGRAEVQLKC